MALNSYVKTLWKNLTSPALNETNLNKIENGIYDATEQSILNTGEIATVKGETASLGTRIDDLPLRYEYAKTVGIQITEDTYNPIVQLASTGIYAGTYQITFSITFKYSTANKSAIFRWSIDGGITWEEVYHEAKDIANYEYITYVFPYDLPDGDIDFQLEGKCESVPNTLDVAYANIILDMKVKG